MLLKDALAFDLSYIEEWRKQFDTLSEKEVFARIDDLFNGCDEESIEVAKFQCRIIKFFFDREISDCLHISQLDLMKILPPKSKDRLLQYRSIGKTEQDTMAIASEIGGNFHLIEESIVHYGVKFLEKEDTRSLASSVAIDVGGYDGDSAMVFAKSYNVNSVHVFEPSKKNFERLVANIEESSFSDRIICNQSFVSDITGSKVRLYGHGLGIGQIPKYGSSAREFETIQTITIDNYCERNSVSNVGLIKIDAEGAGLEAVIGAIDTIRKNRPFLIISVYHTPREFFGIAEFLRSNLDNYHLEIRKLTFDLVKEFVFIYKPID